MKNSQNGKQLSILLGYVQKIIKWFWNSREPKTAQQNKEEDNQLIKKVEIKGTPFTAIRVDKKWFLAFGKYRLTIPLETYEECEQDAKREDWDRLIQMMVIVSSNTVEKMDNEYLAEKVKEQLELEFKKTNGKMMQPQKN